MNNGRFLIILLIIVHISSCGKKDDSIANQIFLNPKTYSKVVKGRHIKITAATLPEFTINQLFFFVDSNQVAHLHSKPWEFNLDTENYDLGSHIIKVMATNSSGITSHSETEIDIIAYTPAVSLFDNRDSITYPLVEIGEQVWMKENLKFKNEYSLFVDNDANKTEEYGLLYITRLASGEGICPNEWHIPSPEEWAILFNHLGGEDIAGGKLKETGTDRWAFPNEGADNSSGFSTRPAGSLTRDSLPEAFGKSARFFTSSYGHYIFINFDKVEIEKTIYHPSNEFYSIRCIRDY